MDKMELLATHYIKVKNKKIRIALAPVISQIFQTTFCLCGFKHPTILRWLHTVEEFYVS